MGIGLAFGVWRFVRAKLAKEQGRKGGIIPTF